MKTNPRWKSLQAGNPRRHAALRALLLSAIAAAGFCGNAWAANIEKANNTTALNLAGSYTAGGPPGAGDVLLVDSVMGASKGVSLGGDLSIAGITVDSTATGSLTINGVSSNTLTLGASGILISTTNTVNLTINTPFVALSSDQTWDMGQRSLSFSGTSTVFNENGHALTITSGNAASQLTIASTATQTLNANIGNIIFNIQGGNLTLTNTNSTFAGAVTNGATVSGSTLSNGNGGTFGKGSFQLKSATMKYTGATASYNQNIQYDTRYINTVEVATSGVELSLSNFTSVSGALAAGSGVTLGGAGNLAISNAIIDNTNVTRSPLVLTKFGAGNLTLTGTSTYTGGTAINQGMLVAINHTALGTGAVTVAANAGLTYVAPSNTTLALASTLDFSGAATLGGTIGATGTSAEIVTTGNATSTTGALTVNVYGLNGVTPTTGTYTLLHGGGASNTLNNFTSIGLGTVFNNTNWTVTGGSLAKSASDITVGVTSATALTSAFWTGNGTAGITKVWAASDGTATSNWASSSGGTVQGLIPGAVDVTIVGTTVAATNTTLGANMTVKSLTIADTTNGLGLNADGFKLTITPSVSTAGITLNASVPASTIGANVALGAAQTWTNNSANTLTVSGVVSSASALALTKAGTGTIALSGPNTYTGTTTVSTGTLLINGVHTGGGNYSVTGILGGSGTIKPAASSTFTVNSGGSIAPGASAGAIGTLTFDGATCTGTVATFTSGATFSFDLNATTNTGDRISLLNGASGDLAFNNISSNVINFTVAGTLANLQSYTLFTADAASAYSGLTLDGANHVTAGLSFAGLGGAFQTQSYIQLVGNNLVLQVVPEPTAWALLLGGLGVLFFFKRAHRRNA